MFTVSRQSRVHLTENQGSLRKLNKTRNFFGIRLRVDLDFNTIIKEFLFCFCEKNKAISSYVPFSGLKKTESLVTNHRKIS